MEFETICIERMQKILLNLTIEIDKALQNSQCATIAKTNTSKAEVPEWGSDFAQHLARFNDIVNIRMKTKPSEKRERENYLRTSILNLENVRAQLQAMERALNEERRKHKQIVDSNMAAIDAENFQVKEIESSHSKTIFRLVKDSDDEIKKIQEAEAAITQELQTKINSRLKQIDVTCRAENQKKEKELYQKRSKVQVEYLNLVTRYDTEVGGLHRTMENLTDQLNDLDEKLKDYRNQLASQEIDYVRLNEERELEILKAFTENLENFSKNRAAKVIQKAWRNYYERWCMRKKKKSKKKK